MSILNFSYATIKDAGAFQEYISKAGALMKNANVDVVVRGEFAKSKRGPEKDAHVAAVFRYSDMAAAEAFYSSPEYQEIVPLRDEACEMIIHFYNE